MNSFFNRNTFHIPHSVTTIEQTAFLAFRMYDNGSSSGIRHFYLPFKYTSYYGRESSVTSPTKDADYESPFKSLSYNTGSYLHFYIWVNFDLYYYKQTISSLYYNELVTNVTDPVKNHLNDSSNPLPTTNFNQYDTLQCDISVNQATEPYTIDLSFNYNVYSYVSDISGSLQVLDSNDDSAGILTILPQDSIYDYSYDHGIWRATFQPNSYFNETATIKFTKDSVFSGNATFEVSMNIIISNLNVVLELIPSPIEYNHIDSSININVFTGLSTYTTADISNSLSIIPSGAGTIDITSITQSGADWSANFIPSTSIMMQIVV